MKQPQQQQQADMSEGGLAFPAENRDLGQALFQIAQMYAPAIQEKLDLFAPSPGPVPAETFTPTPDWEVSVDELNRDPAREAAMARSLVEQREYGPGKVRPTGSAYDTRQGRVTTSMLSPGGGDVVSRQGTALEDASYPQTGERFVSMPDVAPPTEPSTGSGGERGGSEETKAEKESESLLQMMQMLDDAKARRHADYVMGTGAAAEGQKVYDSVRREGLGRQADLMFANARGAERSGPMPRNWEEIQDDEYKRGAYDDFVMQASKTTNPATGEPYTIDEISRFLKGESQ